MVSKWDAERLYTEKAKIFHSVAEKLLYVTKGMRPGIELEVEYFTTRVENCNLDDRKNMKRCITFLKQSKEDKRIIEWSNLKELFNWVEKLFDVHTNMQSHTGGYVSIGYGSASD